MYVGYWGSFMWPATSNLISTRGSPTEKYFACPQSKCFPGLFLTSVRKTRVRKWVDAPYGMFIIEMVMVNVSFFYCHCLGWLCKTCHFSVLCSCFSGMHLFMNIMLNIKYTEFEQTSFVRVALQMEGMILLRENGSEHWTHSYAVSWSIVSVCDGNCTCIGLPLRQCWESIATSLTFHVGEVCNS